MANIVFLTRGSGGDLYPFIPVCIELRSRGHRVTVIADPEFESIVVSYGLGFVPAYLREQAQRFDLLLSQRNGSWGQRFNPELVVLQLNLCLKIYHRIKEQSESDATILVCHDNSGPLGQTIAELLRLSYVKVFLSPYSIMKIPLYDRNDLLAIIINRFREVMNLPPVDDWGAWLTSPRWKIGLWPEWFGPNEPDWMCRIVHVGFVQNPEVEVGEIPRELKEFMAGGERAVLITHGTSEPEKPHFFEASIEACAELGLKGVVVAAHETGIPEVLPSNIRRYRYLPFASLQPLMSAIIYHGGIGTLNQAVIAGLPQLILAHGHDRPDNGQRVRRLGIGESLAPTHWRADRVKEALSRLMTPQVRERCRQLSIERPKTLDPVRTACDLIESSLENDRA
jgi:rhamnosyltransferase subunit B